MHNNILIGAEGIDGTNFLASCLTMSSEVYFNNCDLDGKLKYFLNRISHIEKQNELPIWSEFSMLFYSCARQKNKITCYAYQSKKDYESFGLNKTLINKVQLPLFWPLTSIMSKNPEDPLVKLFESKYFIGLINPDLFVSLRTVLGNSRLDLLTIQEFNSLPKDEQKNFKEIYQTNIERLFCLGGDIITPIEFITKTLHKWNMHNMKCSINYIEGFYPETQDIFKVRDLYKKGNELIKNKITHQWDCNWFLSEYETIENIKFLYSEMNLGKCNEKLISNMYQIWINKIDYIKKSHIKEFNFAINNSTHL